jgi:hypothetical protein
VLNYSGGGLTRTGTTSEPGAGRSVSASRCDGCRQRLRDELISSDVGMIVLHCAHIGQLADGRHIYRHLADTGQGHLIGEVVRPKCGRDWSDIETKYGELECLKTVKGVGNRRRLSRFCLTGRRANEPRGEERVVVGAP